MLGVDRLKYFAAEDYYSDAFLNAVLDKIQKYRDYCNQSGKTGKWFRSLRNYYGISSDGNKSSNLTTRGGESGQLLLGKVADYRNLIQHQLILITSQRPAGEAKAINSDPASLHQARIGSSLVEYYLSQAGWEAKFVRGQEFAQVVDEGFYVLDWDATAGDPVRPKVDEMGMPTGEMIMSGDAILRVVPPWYMARDVYMDSPDSMKWGIFNYRVNKFDLAAKFPNHRDEILNTQDSKRISDYLFNLYRDGDTDMVTVFCLCHDKTPSVPEGRYTLFIPDAVLMDGPLPYAEFNIYRNAQNDIIGTGFGYTNNNDLLQLEECTDAIHSAIMTNQVTFGVQGIIAPKGSGLSYQQLGKGLPFFEVDPVHVDKIRPLELVRTAPELFNYQQTIRSFKRNIAGIDSVTAGDPEGALKSNSGSALALIQSQSLRFNSGAQRAYYNSLSKVCTGLIKLLQRYADSERVIQVTGKVQAQYLNEFKYSKDDLTNVSSVVFHMVDPVSKTPGGALAFAQDLLNQGMIKDPKQYITVARTGSLDVFTEDDEDDQTAIKEENANLRDGKPVQVVATENHKNHIASHSSVIASPASKDNFELVQATSDHIQQHIDMWLELSMSNPALLIATGQDVLPVAQMGMMTAPPPPPDQSISSGTNENDNNMARALGPETPIETKAETVKQPLSPVNPLTGQRVAL